MVLGVLDHWILQPELLIYFEKLQLKNLKFYAQLIQ
jgi:hypothetical protein